MKMSEYKCTASIDGICRNIIGNGIKCQGYSKECALRPRYETLSKAADQLEKGIKNAFGIKGDE